MNAFIFSHWNEIDETNCNVPQIVTMSDEEKNDILTAIIKENTTDKFKEEVL